MNIGTEADLMKAASEWPDAVILVKDWKNQLPNLRLEYPVEIHFPHFPGRIVGNEAEMRPIKLALLQRLSAFFECDAICCADDFHREDKGIPTYLLEETFLCRRGQVLSMPINESLVNEGYRHRDGWQAVEGLPSILVDHRGKLIDHDSAVSALANWIATRDQTALSQRDLTDLIHPEPPIATPWEDRPKPTEAEIEAEIAEEFPTEEELDEEDRQLTTHFERLNAWERGFGTTPAKQLLEDGISLPPPDHLKDEKLTEKLWQVIRGLAENHIYLQSTDHLSDRELYVWLWEKALSDDIMSAAGLPDSAVHFDILGSGDEASKNISLIHYDDAEQRADWHASWPDDEIPAHIDPPHDRDSHLPQREDQ
ncbi:hypothetical protein VSU19_01325 [Verrucomicrobiales bacterium BCK34]|nr:hypothetical protein [Verrucomicrobiales bacterium BCK34]